METQLTNAVSVEGSYNAVPLSITSDVLVVTMLNGLTVTKKADKMMWADGNLTYTIVVTNDAEETFTTPIITDNLDKNLITFVNESITIDGTSASSDKYNYDEATGKLTINLEDITASSSRTITFQVKKA